MMMSNALSKQADDYEKSEGEAFSRPLAVKDRDRKNPGKNPCCFGISKPSQRPKLYKSKTFLLF
jgi:hypothetical protein